MIATIAELNTTDSANYFGIQAPFSWVSGGRRQRMWQFNCLILINDLVKQVALLGGSR
jgi:hypothetical protein